MRFQRGQSEAGIVSILVSIIMMIVVSLIIIGISQVTRSNQRAQLDQQLSSQAYYAAESGVNQAVKFFASNATQKIDTTGNCTSFITSASPSGLGQVLGTGNVLDSGTNTKYTCLMVDSTPPALQKAPLTQDSNTVWHVQDATGANFSQLELKWATNSHTQFTGATNLCNATAPPTFPAYKDWKCSYGILRVDLADVHGTVNTTTGAGLESTARTLYLVPSTTSGVSVAQPLTGNTGQVIVVNCTTICDVKLNPWVVSNDYFIRMTMLYQDSDSVTLTGTDAGGVATFSNGQAVIDVTGKAQDELRRIQARIPLSAATGPIPNFAISSTDPLCKLLTVGSGVTTVDGC
ncbi:MAG TPA: pilus assembly PilX N-terminal domain-containing protein [Candidatus Saccharimonadales bacterium]|nr:pilus assembly PilX N-terminal domain-containing protein [Candidatus Saccharimonadales bacterium]